MSNARYNIYKIQKICHVKLSYLMACGAVFLFTSSLSIAQDQVSDDTKQVSNYVLPEGLSAFQRTVLEKYAEFIQSGNELTNKEIMERINKIEPLIKDNMDDPYAGRALNLLGDFNRMVGNNSKSLYYFGLSANLENAYLGPKLYAIVAQREVHDSTNETEKAIEKAKELIGFTKNWKDENHNIDEFLLHMWVVETTWLAKCYEKQGKVDLAVEQYQMLVDNLEEPNWPTLQNIARLYAENGQTDKAKTAYKKVSDSLNLADKTTTDVPWLSIEDEVALGMHGGKICRAYLNDAYKLIVKYENIVDTDMYIIHANNWAFNTINRFPNATIEEKRKAAGFMDTNVISRLEKYPKNKIDQEIWNGLLKTAYITYIDFVLLEDNMNYEKAVAMLDRLYNSFRADGDIRHYVRNNVQGIIAKHSDSEVIKYNNLSELRKHDASRGVDDIAAPH